MKRNIICFLSSLAFALALVSCGDFLDKNPDLRTTLDSEEKIANILVSAYVSGSGSYQIVANCHRTTSAIGALPRTMTSSTRMSTSGRRM